MTTTTEKYRRIISSPPDALGANADAAVAALNSRFNPDDFHVIRGNEGLEVWLRQVNVGELSDALTSIAGEYGNAGAMAQILQSVESIRSFGVNGNKRLYVGYNDERKVVGRKEKELHRGKHFYANDHGLGRIDNPFPEAFSDQIVCGDSEAVLKQLPENYSGQVSAK